ncbi:mannitol-1-phosphate 5-dehydrogenase, partial [Escherichia coli NE098]
SYHAYRPEP